MADLTTQREIAQAKALDKGEGTQVAGTISASPELQQLRASHLEVDKEVSAHEQLHLRPVTCVDVSADGELIVTGRTISSLPCSSFCREFRSVCAFMEIL